MPKIYSNDVVLIKKKGGFFKGFLRIMVVLLSIVIMVVGGVFLSNLISGNILNIDTHSIKIDKKEFFVISFGEYENYQDCSECSVWVTNSGGSGYVLNDNGVYRVSAQVYTRQSDADLVVENFPSDISYEYKILKKSVSKKVFKIENVSKSDKNQILSDINTVFLTLNSLLGVSNDLDKGVISPVNAGSKVNSLKSDIKIANFSIKSINSTYNDKNLTNLYNFLIKFEDGLDVCINKLLTQDSSKSAIKYCACEMIYNYSDFMDSI